MWWSTSPGLRAAYGSRLGQRPRMWVTALALGSEQVQLVNRGNGVSPAGPDRFLVPHAVPAVSAGPLLSRPAPGCLAGSEAQTGRQLRGRGLLRGGRVEDGGMLLAITPLTDVGLWARGRGLEIVLVDVHGRPRVALLEQWVEGNHQRGGQQADAHGGQTSCPSPTRGSARRSWTGSPSAGTAARSRYGLAHCARRCRRGARRRRGCHRSVALGDGW